MEKDEMMKVVKSVFLAHIMSNDCYQAVCELACDRLPDRIAAQLHYKENPEISKLVYACLEELLWEVLTCLREEQT